MGKQNRQRRAEKRRRNSRRATHHRPRQMTDQDAGRYGFAGEPGAASRSNEARASASSSSPPPLPVDQLVVAAAHAVRARRRDLPTLIDHLTAQAQHDSTHVSKVLAEKLTQAVGQCWTRGWQPADLHHVIGRRLRNAHQQLCATVIAVDAHSYRYATNADPGWLAQVDAVAQVDDVSPPDETDDGARVLDQCIALTHDMADAIKLVVETLAEVHQLPPQPRLCAPPSEWGNGPQRTASATSARRPTASAAPNPKMIERVRALLAKAESTDFPDEAETFTAKAQELIARHAIDVAMLEGTPGERQPASGRRVLLDDPYAKSKGLLLSAIASANHCRAVRNPAFGICTVFGATNDLDAVELLYASLLTQATAAMVREGRSGAHARSRGFRSSFLVAYATRVGQRLREATSAAVQDARTAHGDNVLPVLASRDEAADTARDQAFPRVSHERISPRDPAGWSAGYAAADLARLGPDTELRAG